MSENLCQKFGEQIIEKETKVSEIMELLMNISSNSLETTIGKFREKHYPRSNDEKIHFLFELLCAVRYRPLVIELFASFVKSIFDEDLNEHTIISQMILSFLFRLDFQNSAHMCFLYQLYKIDFIQIDSIFSSFERFINLMGRYNEAPLIVYSWFAQEIETDSRSVNLFKKIQEIIQELKSRNGLSESFEKFFERLDEMKSNDWELYIKYRKEGYNENFIYQLIKSDNIDEYQLLFNQAIKLDMNQTMVSFQVV